MVDCVIVVFMADVYFKVVFAPPVVVCKTAFLPIRELPFSSDNSKACKLECTNSYVDSSVSFIRLPL